MQSAERLGVEAASRLDWGLLAGQQQMQQGFPLPKGLQGMPQQESQQCKLHSLKSAFNFALCDALCKETSNSHTILAGVAIACHASLCALAQPAVMRLPHTTRVTLSGDSLVEGAAARAAHIAGERTSPQHKRGRLARP